MTGLTPAFTGISFTTGVWLEKAEEELFSSDSVDRYTVEIFAEGGAKVFSALIYTENEAEGIFFESDGEAVMDVTAKEIVLEEK